MCIEKDFKRLIEQNERIISEVSELRDDFRTFKKEMRQQHIPRIDVIEKAVPTSDDLDKIREMNDLLGNWRFVAKLIVVLGGIVSGIVATLWVLIQVINHIWPK